MFFDFDEVEAKALREDIIFAEALTKANRSKAAMDILRYDNWCKEMAIRIAGVAAKHGWTTAEDRRCGSRYITIMGPEEDDGSQEVFDVRISDHPQKRPGVEWSFEINDSRESIHSGLDVIESMMCEAMP